MVLLLVTDASPETDLRRYLNMFMFTPFLAEFLLKFYAVVSLFFLSSIDARGGVYLNFYFIILSIITDNLFPKICVI